MLKLFCIVVLAWYILFVLMNIKKVFFVQTFLYKKEIDDINSSGYLKKDTSITDALIENFYQEIMGKEEKVLMDLLLSSNPAQYKLEKLLRDWDIEAKQGAKNLLLANLLKIHPELKATNYEEPRLKGLLQHQRFSNLKILAHYTKIGRELNNHGIIPMIFKGGLMRFLNQEFPRYMGDIDIMVPDKEWVKSAKIAKSLGYWFKRLDVHSFDILENNDSKYGILDIHKFIHIGSKNEKKWIKGLFKRATEREVYGVQTLVPCFEDLMFITLVNLSNNLREHKTQANLLYAIFDCKYLLDNKPDFNWNIVIENTKLTNAEVQINLAMKFINKISENILPRELQSKYLFEKETNDYSRMIMFKNFYYVELQAKSRAMKIQEVFNNKISWSEYLKLKIKYKSLKYLNKHPRLIEIFIKDLNRIYHN